MLIIYLYDLRKHITQQWDSVIQLKQINKDI